MNDKPLDSRAVTPHPDTFLTKTFQMLAGRSKGLSRATHQALMDKGDGVKLEPNHLQPRKLERPVRGGGYNPQRNAERKAFAAKKEEARLRKLRDSGRG